MKYLYLIITAFCLVSQTLHAQQRIEQKTFKIKETGRVGLHLRFGDLVSVTAWDRPEVSFKAVITINSGRLNDALLLDFSSAEDGEILKISSDYDSERIKEGRPGDCPEYGNYCSGTSRHFDENSGVFCSEIVYELKVPRKANVDIQTISADIELKGVGGPVRAESVSGFVDVSWPEQQGAELSLKTISGEAYSDLENIHFFNRKKTVPVVGYELRGRIGTGGPPVRLESVSGDIFLRKK